MNPTTPDVSLAPLIRWGFEQGALMVLLIVIGYFYRKDFQNKEKASEQVIDLLTQQLKQGQDFSTALLNKQAQLTEQSIAVHSQVTTILAEQSAAFKLLLHEKSRDHRS